MRTVPKPWGYELIFAQEARYVGKILHVRAGERLSRQYHRVKDETLLLESGEMDVELGPAGALHVVRLARREPLHIPPGTIHRMIARTDCDVFEVSTPELDDVVRIEDAYGRVNS